MSFDFGSLLQQYMRSPQQVPPEQAEHDFDEVAQKAPTEDLASGVTEAFRSDQTPPFPQMVSQLFGNSSAQDRAGMLNHMLGNLNPQVLSSIMGGVLGNLMQTRGGHQAQPPRITEEQAQQMSPQEVQQIAERAEKDNPGIMEQMGAFYARNPTLVKSLGGAALAIALGRMAQGMQQRRH